MSIDFRSIREISNDPTGRLLAYLSNKFSAFLAKDQADQVDNPEDIYADGQDVESKLTYENFTRTKKFDLNTDYYSPSEPNSDATCRLWLRGSNTGNTIRDISGSERNGSLWGDPILIDGSPFDYGIADSVKSLAIRLNRPTSPLVNHDYITVAFNTRHRAMQALTTGISFFLRFRIHDLSEQNGFSRTLLQKRDDGTLLLPDDGIRVIVSADGRLIVRIRRNGGTQYNNQTATNTIVVNTVYDLWITYDDTSHAVKVYLNNVDKTLTDPGASSTWNHASDVGDRSWYIFKHAGDNSQDGYVYGDFYDFEVLREKIVSSTEVGRHFTNKWTIADIPFGQVMVSNYWCSNPVPAVTGDFEPDSFEADSFVLA